MSRRKTERLLNLLICLLATRRYLTKQDVRRLVPGYPEGSEEAFERAFERDKDELREMGVPVETGSVSGSSLFEDDIGYRVRKEAYALPEVSFAPDEMAVLGLAARAWQSAALAGAAASALRKLQAYGVETDELAVAGLEPRVDASEPAFQPLWQAVRDRRPVRFGYRRGWQPQAQADTGTGTASDAVTRRRVEPWGIVAWHGRWYLVGLDRDRAEPRVFRLSRIVGEVTVSGRAGDVVVPPGVDLRAAVARERPGAVPSSSRVRLRHGSGAFLRRTATAVTDAGGDAVDGWDLLDVAYADAGQLAGDVVGLGADVVVLAPDEVRDAVVRRLAGALSAAQAG